MKVFGNGFATGSTALALMLLVAPLLGLISFQSQVLLVANRPAATTALECGRMLVTVAFTLALAKVDGATGVAAAVTAGCVLETIWALRLTRSYLTQPITHLWPYSSLLALAAAYAGAFAAARVVQASVASFGGLALALIAGSSAYLVLFVALGGVLPRDRARLAPLIRPLLRQRA